MTNHRRVTTPPTDDLRGNRRPAPLPPGRLAGVVNKQVLEKGFGFIREAETGREYFFHYSGTKEGTPDAFEQSYQVGVAVTFEARQTEKGWRASAIERR